MKIIFGVVLTLLSVVVAGGTRSHGPTWLFWSGWGGIALGLFLIFQSVRKMVVIEKEATKKEKSASLEERYACRIRRGGTPHR